MTSSTTAITSDTNTTGLSKITPSPTSTNTTGISSTSHSAIKQTTHIPTSAFTPVNDLPQDIKEPIKITTSKKWVLPPRPKPGRKPVSYNELDTNSTNTNNTNNINNTDVMESSQPSYRQILNEKKSFSFTQERNNSISNILPNSNLNSHNNIASSPTDLPGSYLSPKSTSSCIPTPSPTPDSLSPKLESNVQPLLNNSSSSTSHIEKKRKTSPSKANTSSSKKKSTSPNASTTNYNNKMIEVDCSIIHNPKKTEILKINEENYYLKLEVIRLVSNLKTLRDEIQPLIEKRKLKSNKNKKDKLVKSKSVSTSIKPKEKEQTTSSNKKRGHDEDINDLILSLIDLSHSQQTVEQNKSTDNSLPCDSINDTKDTQPTTKMDTGKQITDPLLLPNDLKQNPTSFPLDHNHSTTSYTQSPVFTNDLVNDPFLEFSSKSLVERQILYDEDEIDLLSTVSTTPSTMFSLSQCVTNDTIDSLNGSTVLNELDHHIDEMQIPPFELLNLPDQKSILNGKLDIKLNYNMPANDNKFPMLDTFTMVDESLNNQSINTNTTNNNNKIGSLELLNLDDKKLSNQLFNDTEISNSMYNNDSNIVDFTMTDDVDFEFENFINGKNVGI